MLRRACSRYATAYTTIGRRQPNFLDGDAHQGGREGNSTGGTGRQLYRAGGGRLEDDAVSQSLSEGIAYLLHIFVVCHELLDLL